MRFLENLLKKVSIFLLFALIFNIAFIEKTSSTFAMTPSENIKSNWENFSDVMLDKIWTLTLTKAISDRQFNDLVLVVLNESQEQVSVKMELSKDKKSILISPPKEGYNSGERYTVSLKSKSRINSLKNNVNFTFDTVKTYVLPNKIWTITLGQDMNEEESSKLQAVVLGHNNKIPVSYSVASDHRSIQIIPPQNMYQTNETYTLIVGYGEKELLAKRKFTIIEDNLEAKTRFQKPGVYIVDDIQGNAVISSDKVALQDCKIEGNLTISKEVASGSVYLQNVKGTGALIVQGGGPHSVNVIDCAFYTMEVDDEKNEVRIVAKGNTSVGDVVMRSGGTIENATDSEAVFGKLNFINIPKGVTVILKGNLGNVVSQSADIKINLEDAKVESLSLNAAAEVTADGNTEISKLGVSSTAVSSKINIDKSVEVAELTIDGAATISGTGTIGLAKVNAAGTVIKCKPERIESAPWLIASVDSTGAIVYNAQTSSPPYVPTPVDISDALVKLAVVGTKTIGSAFDLSITGAKNSNGASLSGMVNVTVLANNGSIDTILLNNQPVSFAFGIATVPITISDVGTYTVKVKIAGVTAQKIVPNVIVNNTVPTKVILNSGSLGVEENQKITGLMPGNKYQIISGGVTSYVKEDGTVSTNEDEIADLIGTEITGLINGVSYTVQIVNSDVTVTSTAYTVDNAANTITGDTTAITTGVSVQEFLGNLTKGNSGAEWKVSEVGPPVVNSGDFDVVVAKAITDKLASGDRLIVKAVGAVKTYNISVTVLSMDSTVTSSVYIVNNTAIESGASMITTELNVQTFLGNLTKGNGNATWKIVTGTTAITNEAEFNSAVAKESTDKLASGDKLVVKSEAGTIKTYDINVVVLSSNTAVTSTVYIIDSILGNIAGRSSAINTNVDVQTFLENLTKENNSTAWKVLASSAAAVTTAADFDGATGKANNEKLVVGDKLVVKAENGAVKTYTIQVTSNDATVTSTAYNVNSDLGSIAEGAAENAAAINTLINVETFLSNLAKGNGNARWKLIAQAGSAVTNLSEFENATGKGETELLAKGDKLVVIAEDGVTVKTYTIKVLSALPSNIYWVDYENNQILKNDLSGNTSVVLSGPNVAGAGTGPVDVIVDNKGDKIYWRTKNQIRRANLDGSFMQIIADNIVSPKGGMAIDFAANKIYWGTTYMSGGANENTIFYANLDGTASGILFSGTVVSAAASEGEGMMDLITNCGKIYWCTSDGLVRRANVTDGGYETIITDTGCWINGIAIDASTGKIYWAAANSNNPELRKIGVAGLDGSGQNTLLDGAYLNMVDQYDNPMHVAAGNGKLYWTTNYSRLFKYDGSAVNEIAIPLQSSIPQIYQDGGIALSWE